MARNKNTINNNEFTLLLARRYSTVLPTWNLDTVYSTKLIKCKKAQTDQKERLLNHCAKIGFTSTKREISFQMPIFWANFGLSSTNSNNYMIYNIFMGFVTDNYR